MLAERMAQWRENYRAECIAECRAEGMLKCRAEDILESRAKGEADAEFRALKNSQTLLCDMLPDRFGDEFDKI